MASAQRSAAYRIGGKSRDPYTGKPINFSNKKGVVYSEVLLPDGPVPAWARDAWSLAEAVQQVEKRKDARYFKEQEVSLPICLPMAERIALARKFVLEQVVRKRQLACIVAIHRYGGRKERFKRDENGRLTDEVNEVTAALVKQWEAEGLPFLEEAEAAQCDRAHVMIERNKKGDIVGWRPFQPHMHDLITFRKLCREGFAPTKDRGLDHTPVLLNWREKWAEYCNEALAAAGREERIDHRTLEAQRDDPRAYPPVHPAKLPLPGHDVAAEYIRNPTGGYEEQLKEAEDVRAYNASFDLAGLVARAVTGFMEGGVVGLAENVMGQAVHAGLLPGVDKALMSIPRTVVRMVDGLVHGRPAQ
ncbi:MAG: MobA/MobL family protein [Acetobacteraceae bacterium]